LFCRMRSRHCSSADVLFTLCVKTILSSCSSIVVSFTVNICWDTQLLEYHCHKFIHRVPVHSKHRESNDILESRLPERIIMTVSEFNLFLSIDLQWNVLI